MGNGGFITASKTVKPREMLMQDQHLYKNPSKDLE